MMFILICLSCNGDLEGYINVDGDDVDVQSDGHDHGDDNEYNDSDGENRCRGSKPPNN